jgi:hypothetical protein
MSVDKEAVAAKLMAAAFALGSAEMALEEAVRELALDGNLDQYVRAGYERIAEAAPRLRMALRSVGMALDRAALVKAMNEDA